MYTDYIKLSIRLRMLALIIAVLSAVFSISTGFYVIGTAVKQRDAEYAEKYADYEYTASLWDEFSDEYSAEEIIEAIGERPEEPVKQNISYTVVYEGFARLFLIMVITVFLCATLMFFSYVCSGINAILNEPLLQDKSENK